MGLKQLAAMARPVREIRPAEYIHPETGEAALTFVLKYPTNGSNAEARRLLTIWRTDEDDTITGDDKFYLAFLLSLTQDIQIDLAVLDTPTLRQLQAFWQAVCEELFTDETHDHVVDDPEVVQAVWDAFTNTVHTELARVWRRSWNQSTVLYPADDLIRKSPALVEREQEDPDFLSEDASGESS